MNFRSYYASLLILSAVGSLTANSVAADPGRITVHVDRPGVRVSPMLYGLMTEEINHSYDGGLYAELIQNRALNDDSKQPAHWSPVMAGNSSATIGLDTDAPPKTALTKSLRVDIARASAGEPAGVANDGYWGVPIRSKTAYRASFYAKAAKGFHGPLTLSLQSADGAKIYAVAHVPKLTGEWRKYTAVLTTGSVAPTPDGRFAITASTPGSFNVTEVSLFPPTYHNRPNGDRVDLSEKLAAMHPRLLRFPGGNYLEGNTIAERFEWKNTIGPIDQRPGHWGPWGYRSSDGMGLAEFLGWCDDLHMEPLLAVYAGFSLAGNRQPDPQIVKPGPALQPFVQDALDEIEYVIGDKSTKWGGVRARDGHPAPYKLEYVEIGNEDFFDGTGSYDGRFAQFYDAIKARYPHLKLIATTTVHNRTPDLYDEHYYRSPAAMEKDATHYDSYDRHGPKVFVGEWASQEGQPTPDMNSALGDAAWMTGLERNTDVVLMNTYAPLLVNVNPGGRQWGTNLIGYDSLTSFGSPSYYAQVMFASNLGDVTLPVDLSIPQYEPAVDTHPKGRIGVGTWRTQAEFKDIKVTHAGQTLYAKDFASGDSDWQLGTGNWQVVDGALRQTGDGERCWAVAGDPSWTDYTLTLKARKISGAEGFLIRFHDIDDANWVWWNVGGWGNTRTQLQRSVDGNQFEIGPSSKATVETGRWYDIKVDVDGPNIRCYLDGKLVTEAVDAAPTPPESAYASAMLDRRSGDVILKVVNIAADPQDIAISLDGLVPHGTSSRHTVHAIVLSGEPRDVNTIDDPTKVVPHKSFFKVDGSRFQHTFPAHSVTVLRIHE